MSNLFHRILGWAIVAILMAIPAASALTVQTRSFSELVNQADTIVVATAISMRSDWAADNQTIYTFVTLSELDVIKGDVPSATYELRMPGGVIDDRAQIYPGMPALENGQRYVLFIRGHMQELIPLVGVYQGLYKVIENTNDQARVLRADIPLTTNNRSAVSELSTLNAFTSRIRAELMSLDEISP